MNRAIWIIIAFWIFIHPAWADNIVAATAEWKPYAMQTEQGFKGIAVDILKEIFQRTGDTVSIKLYPAVRLNCYFDDGKIDINFADSIYWNKINAPPAFIFTDTYLFLKEYVYSIASGNIEIRTLKDLHGRTVGTTRGYYYSMVEDAFNQGLVKNDKTNSDELLFQKLITHRNSIIFMDEYAFNYYTNETGCDKTIFNRGLQLTYAPLAIKVRIEKKHLIKRFNHAINEMRADGSILKIIDRYLSLPAAHE